MSGKNAQNIFYFTVFEGFYFFGARENAFFDVSVFDDFVICVSRHLWRSKLQNHQKRKHQKKHFREHQKNKNLQKQQNKKCFELKLMFFVIFPT